MKIPVSNYSQHHQMSKQSSRQQKVTFSTCRITWITLCLIFIERKRKLIDTVKGDTYFSVCIYSVTLSIYKYIYVVSNIYRLYQKGYQEIERISRYANVHTYICMVFADIINVSHVHTCVCNHHLCSTVIYDTQLQPPKLRVAKRRQPPALRKKHRSLQVIEI